MTYAFASSTAVLGPLSREVEPNSYDLCARHAERTSAPVGWDVIRLPLTEDEPSEDLATDDLVALANAVREVGFADPKAQPIASQPTVGRQVRHLRVLGTPEPLG